MASCNINALAAKSGKWTTLDIGVLAVIEAQLWCQIFQGNMATGTCDKNALMALAAANGYEEADSGTLQVLKVALLAQIAQTLNPALNITANGLMANAGCFACQDPGVLQVLELQLLCEINGGS